RARSRAKSAPRGGLIETHDEIHTPRRENSLGGVGLNVPLRQPQEAHEIGQRLALDDVDETHDGRSVQMMSSGSALSRIGRLLQPMPRPTMRGPRPSISNRPCPY